VTVPRSALAAALVTGVALGVASDASLAPPATTASLVAVGDIAACDSQGDEITAQLAASLPGPIAALGDTVYESGTHDEYERCFAPSWGSLKPRIRPAVGNHEYYTRGAAGYFRYFGSAARWPHGYYSYDLGRWHVVVLNTNCLHVEGGCRKDSPQERWLRRDLRAHRTTCTLAYAHHPRFSSGKHGNLATLRPLWQALYDHGADVVLAGHEHDYERFAPQTPAGKLDRRRGIRQFVVGTGGRSLTPVAEPLPLSEKVETSTRGVLALTLRPKSYSWRFVPEPGKSFHDAGWSTCH
jgi:hypothetical protein